MEKLDGLAVGEKVVDETLEFVPFRRRGEEEVDIVKKEKKFFLTKEGYYLTEKLA